MSKTKLNVNELEIVLYKQNEEEYISLTDMAKFRDSERTNYIIQNWMRTRNTIEFLGLILKASNSMPLEMNLGQTVLLLHQKNG